VASPVHRRAGHLPDRRAALRRGQRPNHPGDPQAEPGRAERGSLAYFTYRRLACGEDRSELGAIGHGPDGAKLADRIAEHIRTWDHDRAAVPTLAVFPAGTPDRLTTRTVIDKRHTRLTFSW